MAEATRKIEPAVLAMFARRFPGIELRTFNYIRKDQGYTRDETYVSFVGPEDRLIDLGLAEPAMIAKRPKRVLYDPVYSERLRGGNVLVRRELDENFPRDHALSAFGPWNYPYVETAGERRARFREDLLATVGCAIKFAGASIGTIKDMEMWGLSVDDDTRRKLDAAYARFEADLQAIAGGFSIASPRPKLEIRVNNAR